MNYREHEPAHFHVRYQGYEASIQLKTRTLKGHLPRRALRLVYEWMDIHSLELQENWDRIKNHEPLLPIEPLP